MSTRILHTDLQALANKNVILMAKLHSVTRPETQNAGSNLENFSRKVEARNGRQGPQGRFLSTSKGLST